MYVVNKCKSTIYIFFLKSVNKKTDTYKGIPKVMIKVLSTTITQP